MPYYDLCFIKEPMGYFERTETFDALNDEVAVSIAQRHQSEQPLELWSGGRLVERFGPTTPAVAAPAKSRRIAAA